MAVSQIVTITKNDAVFASKAEAVSAYKLDGVIPESTETFNQAAIDSGDLVVESTNLTSEKDGYIFSHTWTDAKWNEITTSKTFLPNTDQLSDAVTLSESINGWFKSVVISYSS